MAYQIPDGWLVSYTSDTNGSTTLWLLKPDGSALRLLDGVRGYAVAPDGYRVAWRAGNRLHVGHLTGTSLTDDRSTPAPARGDPIAYTGAAVVLGYSMTGAGIDQHDVWIPANGDYSPSWDKTQFVIAVYQPAPDGSLLGLVQRAYGSKDACLAKLDPAANLRAVRTACGLPITLDPDGLVSPDGHWLAKSAVSPGGQLQIDLIDLHTVFDHPVVTTTWVAIAPLAWVDATTAVVTQADNAMMLAHVGQQDLTPVTGPDLPDHYRLQPIPRLG
jgi:hypothetical protein